MRKIAPNDIKTDFSTELQALKRFHNRGYSAFTTPTDRSTLTEHSLLTAAVLWEGFVNDIFIAYINREPSTFKDHLRNSFEETVKKEWKSKRIYQMYGKLSFPKHLKKNDIETFASRFDGNVTFSDFKQLEKQAEKWLSKNHADKFKNLTTPQKATIDALIAIRNHLAHRSKASLERMNQKLDEGALNTTGIKRGKNEVKDVGAWLKAKPPTTQDPRFTIIIGLLDTIARAL